MRLGVKRVVLLLVMLFSTSIVFGQDEELIIPDVLGAIEHQLTSTSITTPSIMTPAEMKKFERKSRKDSIRATKKLWLTVLGGPSYTPEASFGLAGAVLASFRLDKNDTISQRSFFPMGVNMSLNGTIVVSGAGMLFFNENKFRIRTTYSYRSEPSNYYGKGYDTIDKNHQSDSTTLFTKEMIRFDPQFIWDVKKNFYIGAVLDIAYSSSWDINPVMEKDPYFSKYGKTYTNIGLGSVIQYDSRDDIATPSSGMLVSSTHTYYTKYLGGSYNFHQIDIEYRQFKELFDRAVLGWVARAQMSYGDTPFTELPTFGSPTDLRGYSWGKYRDKSAGYGIVEYRQMLGSQADYNRGALYTKLGFAAWAGAGSIGETIADWNKWKYNYGVGLRIEIQPKKNFRLDIGKAHGTKGVLVYFNMTEAF